MAVVQFSVVPLGTGSTSLSTYVAEVHKVLEATGLTHRLTPMGTVIEGELDQVLAAIRKAHEVPFGQGAQRVMTLINIDDRRDKKGTAAGKMASVEAKLKA